MKKIIILALTLFATITATFAQTYVQGHYRKDGTYVQGHYRSSTNSTNHDNYGTRGNSNPYTGTSGSVARDYSTEASSYGSGRTVYTGSQGGQYYINSSGNKTYVPKQPQSSSSSYSRSKSRSTSSSRGW